jgi:hypothetical protein
MKLMKSMRLITPYCWTSSLKWIHDCTMISFEWMRLKHMDEFDTMVNNNDLEWTLIWMAPLKYSTWMELCIWIKFDNFGEIWLHGWNLKLSWMLKLITLIHHGPMFSFTYVKPMLNFAHIINCIWVVEFIQVLLHFILIVPSLACWQFHPCDQFDHVILIFIHAKSFPYMQLHMCGRFHPWT